MDATWCFRIRAEEKGPRILRRRIKVGRKTPEPDAIAEDSTAIHGTSTPNMHIVFPELCNEPKIIFRNMHSGKKRNSMGKHRR